MAGKPVKLSIAPKATNTGAAPPGGDLLSGVVDAAKSLLGLTDPGSPIEVLYNPKEYTIEQSNTFAEIGIPGLEAPILQFVRGNTEKLSFDLLIDTTDKPLGSADRDASLIANRILKLARVDGERHAPPVVSFAWGGQVLDGVIESCRRQFVLFDPDGKPTRIVMALAVKRYRTLKEQLGDMNRKSPDRTRTVVVVAGDTLPAIAFRAYGDDSQWRAIADHNGIADPALLEPGLVLEVPSLTGGAL
ncbi:MAG TPA: LysM peptidoglycan-binding domain-containing protein [Polyangiaceae bacterium]|nr:LysM peptidoglycan-binding domain-containing protein [Polyangiaceae bacterium]